MGKHSHLSKHLPDIQKTEDKRGVAIHRVGVGDIRVPISILEEPSGHMRNQVVQRTVGTVRMFVALEKTIKGVHMSRFSTMLMDRIGGDHTLGHSDLIPLAEEMLDTCETNHSYVEVDLEYFRTVQAPVSKIKGVSSYKASLKIEAIRGEKEPRFKIFTGVEVIGKTCCPCSKEISDYDVIIKKGRGAHAQRGHVSLTVENSPEHVIWFEQLIRIAEKSVSCPVYPILKRVDERHVTMTAYKNPKFVEDVVRDAAVQLRKLGNIYQFWIHCKNDESIHFNSAEAYVHELI